MNISDINLFKRLKKSPLQKEIDELNSNLGKNELKQGVDISNNLSFANAFIVPNDGYVCFVGKDATNSSSMYINNIQISVVQNWFLKNCIYVRKGMKIHFTDNPSQAYFLEFI